MQETLRLTEKGWEAVRTRALAKVPDEFGMNPCPGAGVPCGVRTRNALCHFCTRTVDRGIRRFTDSDRAVLDDIDRSLARGFAIARRGMEVLDAG